MKNENRDLFGNLSFKHGKITFMGKEFLTTEDLNKYVKKEIALGKLHKKQRILLEKLKKIK